MPRLDGTGPRGQGAKTGHGLGLCDRTKSNCPCLCCRLGRRISPRTLVTLKDEEEALLKELAAVRKKKAVKKTAKK